MDQEEYEVEELTNPGKSGELVPEYEKLNERFQNALQVVDDIVLKNYISRLHDFQIVPLDEQAKERNLSENVRLFRITEMVYEKDENSLYKFASVFNALSTANCAVFIIVDSNGEKTDFYMGIRSMDSDRTTNSLKDTLQNAMVGQFPGIKTQDYLDEDMKGLLGKVKADNISIVSCVANTKETYNYEDSSFIQGLEKLALAMQGERYTGIILANGTTQNQLEAIRKGYEEIYTQLSPFARSQISYASNYSVSLSQALSKGMSVGKSYSESHSTTTGNNKTKGTSSTQSVSEDNAGSKAAQGIAAASGILGVALSPLFEGAMAIGGLLSGSFSGLGNALRKTKTNGLTQNESETISRSETAGNSTTSSNTETETNTDTKALNQGTGQTLILNTENKTISNILQRLDTQLQRLQEFESLGMWECAAYFMSEKPYAAEIAASTYKALMRGENSGVEVCAINSWRSYEKKEVGLLKEYALNMMHPVFEYRGLSKNIQVTPCSLVSGNELAIHMGLPRKSVCGFPVIEHADFGKEVVSYSHENSQAIVNLGHIFNMGSECNNSVKLDRNSLAMHTFITGATGSGKSNTIYEILQQLDTVGIHFMVIEPAKGEYKNVFGNNKGVRVLGTNPFYSELIRINPFKFPKGIHILEHIDRLIEIFNVCWPMYAAMPAVLKEAVLQAYKVCGWDLVESRNLLDEDLFPNFQDLLMELSNVIELSAYDTEVKSNYKGSLETRVKSLTNGLNGEIFSTQEIENEILFDSDVIIDLSRVGSLETKSLLMGILIMRLNEYRMTHSEGMNLSLKHVTVLEEAHNILKRTSTAQSMEDSNITGKSVEMISNAIAEMRTYGEGFIIADQSPSAVDLSAIRNTNTKIIMRLPDEMDRQLAGKAAALREDQLLEIAKLPKGVAVVYQNDWLEPVLCKVGKFEGKEIPYVYDVKSDAVKNNDGRFKREFLSLLMKERINEKIRVDTDFLKDAVSSVNLSTRNKIEIHWILDEYRRTNCLKIWEPSNFQKLSRLVTELLECRSQVEYAVLSAHDFNELNDLLNKIIIGKTQKISDELCVALSQCLIRDFCMDDDKKLEIYAAWREDILSKYKTIEEGEKYNERIS